MKQEAKTTNHPRSIFKSPDDNGIKKQYLLEVFCDCRYADE